MASNQPTWVEIIRRHPEADAEGWQCCPGLSLAEAEQVLDWLEANGVQERELRFEEEQGCTVRWRRQRVS